MINLAGYPCADLIIRKELTRCGIAVIESDTRLHHPDVKTALVGKLGPFDFARNWYYWVACGPVPLAVAEELYEDPVGRTDVRSGGDCACRPPATWADYYDAEGRKLVADDPAGTQETQYRELVESEVLTKEGFERLRWVRLTCNENSRTEIAPLLRELSTRAEVTTFHIDSELGLYLFVQALKKHGLVPP